MVCCKNTFMHCYLQKEIHDLEMQLSDEFENKQNCFQQLATLKAELEKEMYVLLLIYG